MYAIIEFSGRQWRVEPGSRLDVNRVGTAVGAALPVERVLFANDGTRSHIGTPYLSGAKVVCEVIEHRLGPKEISYHYRRRENWRKTRGHRQPLTRLIVKDILLAGAAPAAGTTAEAAPAKVAKPATARKNPLTKTPTVTKKKVTLTSGNR